MKLLRGPRHRQLLQALKTARQRAGLTAPQLADRVSGRAGFIEKYERGQDGHAAIPEQPRLGGRKSRD